VFDKQAMIEFRPKAKKGAAGRARAGKTGWSNGGSYLVVTATPSSAATWVASTGSRAAGREAQAPRLVGACERQVRGFFGGRAALLGL
jgi:hypothetical protein